LSMDRHLSEVRSVKRRFLLREFFPHLEERRRHRNPPLGSSARSGNRWSRQTIRASPPGVEIAAARQHKSESVPAWFAAGITGRSKRGITGGRASGTPAFPRDGWLHAVVTVAAGPLAPLHRLAVPSYFETDTKRAWPPPPSAIIVFFGSAFRGRRRGEGPSGLAVP